jgi:hypothetical protein
MRRPAVPPSWSTARVLAALLALRRVGEGFEITATRRAGYDRPWARAIASESTPPEPSRRPAQPRDATPRADDLEPGD